MKLRLLQIGLFALPSTVLAQPSGFVTVAPLGTAAPALGWLSLAVLALALAGGAFVLLRRAPAMARNAAVVLTIVGFGVTAYSAVVTIVISDDQCHEETLRGYNASPGNETTLSNACPNAIRIVDIELTCTAPGEGAGGGAALASCDVDQLLVADEECFLPLCDPV